jgi:hypothetical protein
MKDARRYGVNAAECILAAGGCEPAYRDLTFAVAEAWLSRKPRRGKACSTGKFLHLKS